MSFAHALTPGDAVRARAAREGWSRRARWAVLLAALGAIWTLVRWPDASRIPVDCVVVAHVRPVAGRRGHDGRVQVRARGEEAWFDVVGRVESDADVAKAFANWPVGATRTCWLLPYPSRAEQLTGAGASFLPPAVPVVVGLALWAWSLFRARAPSVKEAGVVDGGPYRRAAAAGQPLPALTLSWPRFSKRQRALACCALVFWALLFGAFFLSNASVPSPPAIVEPGSALRLGLGLFALMALGLPGGFFFWPSVYALAARVTVHLDATDAVLGVSEGALWLAAMRWTPLPADARLAGDALITSDLGAPSLPVLTGCDPAALAALAGWLDAWRARARP